jgi:hypothetical protein
MTTHEKCIENLPDFKLPYEIIIDKKVSKYDVCLGIPRGVKCLAWFTCFQGNNICKIIEIDINGNYKSVYTCKTSFDDKLSMGTILYGTEFEYKKCRCFTVEDIIQFRGNMMDKNNFENKLSLMSNLFENYLNQTALNSEYLLFGLPIMNSNFSNFIFDSTSSGYDIDHVQFKIYNSFATYSMPYKKPGFLFFTNRNEYNEKLKIKEKEKEKSKIKNSNNVFKRKSEVSDIYKIFTIKAELDNDIYSLFINDKYQGTAIVKNYKTSVYLNSIFRNIKENINLDSLEESDSEGEFENNFTSNKFVNLNKSVEIKCKWEPKFKKWSPIIE